MSIVPTVILCCFGAWWVITVQSSIVLSFVLIIALNRSNRLWAEAVLEPGGSCAVSASPGWRGQFGGGWGPLKTCSACSEL